MADRQYELVYILPPDTNEQQVAELHEQIGALPDEEREIVGLLFYQGVSQAEAAEMLGLSETIGALRPGMEADVTVLTEKPGRYILSDNEKTEVVADSLLQPVFCLRAGVRHDAVAPILPRAVAA